MLLLVGSVETEKNCHKFASQSCKQHVNLSIKPSEHNVLLKNRSRAVRSQKKEHTNFEMKQDIFALHCCEFSIFVRACEDEHFG